MWSERYSASIEDYHAGIGYSSSQLTDYIENPQLFQARYLTKTIPRREETPSLEFGQLLDRFLLGESGPGANVIVQPEDIPVRRGKAWTEFQEEHAGKIILRQKQFGPFRQIMENCKKQPVAWSAITDPDAENQVSVRWYEETCGLLLRCRPDIVNLNRGYFADLKSTRRERDEFAKEICNFRYDLQMIHYQRGLFALTGEVLPFFLIVCQNRPPYSVWQQTIDDDWKTRARSRWQSMVTGVASSIESGVWLPEGGDGIERLHCPSWHRI